VAAVSGGKCWRVLRVMVGWVSGRFGSNLSSERIDDTRENGSESIDVSPAIA
jgi:hypothetical protein